MKVRIEFHSPDVDVDETVEGADADEVVGRMQEGVAARMKPVLRFLVRSMGRVAFAQEVVRRYNDVLNKTVSLPGTCEEFINLAEREGIVQVLER